MNRSFLKMGLVAAALLSVQGLKAQMPALVNEPVDVSPDFRSFAHTCFLGDSLAGFNTATASGTIKWGQSRYFPDPLKGTVKWTIHPYNTK